MYQRQEGVSSDREGHMDPFVGLVLVLLGLAAAAVMAVYVTVALRLWFELRRNFR
jgi:hypothetical protein